MTSTKAVFHDGNHPGTLREMTAEEADHINEEMGTNFFFRCESTPGALDRAQAEVEEELKKEG